MLTISTKLSKATQGRDLKQDHQVSHHLKPIKQKMNIRGLNTNPISPIEPKARIEKKTRMQSSTSDRDADGRRERSEGEAPRALKQEDFDQALEVLRNMPGLKSNDLILKVEMEGAQRITSIVDPNGKVIRRLTDAQLWAATRDKDRQTGKILDKAM